MKNEQNSLDTKKYFKTTQKKFYREIWKETINIKEPTPDDYRIEVILE